MAAIYWLYHSETCHDIFSFRSEMEKVYSIQFNFGIPPHFSSHTLYILLYIYIFIYIIKFLFRFFYPCEKKTVYCILYTMVSVLGHVTRYIEHCSSDGK